MIYPVKNSKVVNIKNLGKKDIHADKAF